MKIPKNLSDKDMFAGYKDEEISLEDQFMAAEKADKKKHRQQQFKAEADKRISLAGIDDALAEKLGRELLQLKLQLFQDGVKNYTMKIKRDGYNIILTPVEK